MTRPLPLLAVVAMVVACSNPDANILKSSKQRITSPDAPAADVSAVSAGNTAYGVAELQRQATTQNVIFSPYSASLALAMLYQGSNANTQTQMATALSFPFAPARLAPAFDALDLAITGDAQGGVSISEADAAWVQKGFTVLPAYLDTLAQDYGAGVGIADFETQPQTALDDINGWASAHTHGKIPTLFAPGSIGSDTRLVLANAVYFKASWQTQFDSSKTQNATFTRLDGSTVWAPTMNQQTQLALGKGTGYQAVELPYVQGTLSMVVVKPDPGTFSSFVSGLSQTQVDAIASGLNTTLVQLALPRFTIQTSLNLATDLQALGMVDAFTPQADFSGIDGAKDLSVETVVQKAFIAVDESGTEAAAATGVGVGINAVQEPTPFSADHPFVYFIRDVQTGAVLFVGFVVDPTASSTGS